MRRQAVRLGAGGEPDALQVGDAGAVVDRQADHDGVVFAVGRAPQAGFVAGEQWPQRLRHLGRAEAKVRCRLAAQPHRQGRLGGLQIAVEVDHARDGGCTLHHLLGQSVSTAVSGPCNESWSCFCTPPPGAAGNVDRRQDAAGCRPARSRIGWASCSGERLRSLMGFQAEIEARLVLAVGIAGIDRAVGVVDLGEFPSPRRRPD